MFTNRDEKLSFIITIQGEIVPAMPDDEEFSPQQIRDYVAGPPELAGETHDGYLVFRNREGEARGLTQNAVAAAMYSKSISGKLLGKIFMGHPAHIPPYWKKLKVSQ